MSDPIAPASREDFRDAAARHRRAAWRVTAVCALAYSVLGIVVALGLSPLLWGIIGVAFDMANLVVPTPDILHYASLQLDANNLARVSAAHDIWLAALAALPGIGILGIAASALRKALLNSTLFAPGQSFGRPALAGNLAEIQWVHTVEEMAVAGRVAMPRVVFIDGSSNGVAYGLDTGKATVLIGAQLVTLLTRAQMQAVAAHFIASIADGDLAIGLRTACTVGVFSLVQRLGMEVLSSIENRDAFRLALRLLRALFIPTATSTALILSELSNPLAAVASPCASVPAGERRMTWREWALMPALGPVFFNGLIGGIINSMVLCPLVHAAWRQRKYIADATAVRLTRDPDSLDGALAAIKGAGTFSQIPPWAAHLCIIEPHAARGGIFNLSHTSTFPSAGLRHAALIRMGSRERSALAVGDPVRRMKIMNGILSALVFVVMMFALGAAGCAYCLCLITTLFPIGLLHTILR